MKKKFLLFCFSLLVVNLSAQTSIFNGKDLSGWKIHGTELWYVAEGLLICESGPDKGYGYLATEKIYKNFQSIGYIEW